jgi:hypothetical protein
VRALALLVLLAAPALAAPTAADLGGQFPDAATRNQGATGSCHIFTTVSLIEAALYRRHGLRLPLSEADLFVRKVVSDPDYYDRARKAVGAGDGAASAYSFVEGGSPFDDISFALKNGVAKAATAPWSAFAARYDAYKKKRKAEIEAKRERVVASAGGVAQIKEDYAAIGRQEAAGGTDYFASVARSNLRRIEPKIVGHHLAELASFREFLDQVEGRSPADAESLLHGDPKVLAADRAAVKAMTGPFRVRKLDFGAACKDGGAAQKAGLLAALDRGIPVSVAMELGGLKEWGQERAKTARHAFTITGYSRDAAGAVTLKSRNSWGGDNPDVTEDRFCRISRVVAVLTDKEYAGPK